MNKSYVSGDSAYILSIEGRSRIKSVSYCGPAFTIFRTHTFKEEMMTSNDKCNSTDEHDSDDDDLLAALFSGQDEEPIWNGDRSQLAPESEGLEPMPVGGGMIGYHADINGPDAILVDFRPTRAELMTLGHHYLDRYFAVQENYAMGQSGSWEIREAPFAWRRFCSIAETLSPGQPIEGFEDYIAKREAEIEELRAECEAEATA